VTVRLAHFTDMHITENPRLVGWTNLAFFGRFASHRDAPAIARALVRDLERLAPDHIVSTGDFTGLSLRSEFAAAREVLLPLLDSGRAVTVIPGNHDVYVRSAARERLYESVFGPWIRTDLAPEDLPAGTRDLYPYPLVRFLGEEAVLVCLRDVRPTLILDSSGRAGKRQLLALAALLRHPRLAGRTKVLVLHYGLRRADGTPDAWHHRLRDAEAVLALAEEAGVVLALHGHIHSRYVLPSGTASPVAMANPGSLTSSHGARAYHLITLDGGAVSIEARRYDAAAGEFVAWRDAPGTGLVARCPTSREHSPG
jgi:3',5'-cyclic AMP phosphodiesterase CpdA